MKSFIILMFLLCSNVNGQVIEIGVSWKGRSSMAERVYSSFLKSLGPHKEKFNFEEFKEEKGKENFRKRIKYFENSKQGMLLFRSSAFKAVAEKNTSIPTFLGAGNNPIALGVADKNLYPIKNATGVSYYIPVEKHFKIINTIFPRLKRLTLVVEKGHPGGDVERAETLVVCREKKFKCEFVLVKKDSEVISKIKKVKSDIIILGAQDLVMRNMKKISRLNLSTPIISYASKPVKDGALLGFVASDEILGEKLAKNFLEHFIEQKSIKEIPFKLDTSPKFLINESRAKYMKLEIPFEVLNAATIIK